MSATYEYSARTAEGERVRGTLHALSVEAAAALLRRRSLAVVDVKPARTLRPRIALATIGVRSPRRAMLAFFRAFSAMLRAGLAMRRALLVAIERCEDARLREAIRGVLADIEHGSALSAAMRRRPREFPALEVAMVEAGESGGVLDDVLERIAEGLERDHAVRSRLRSALAYPAIVALTAGALIAFLLVRIVPMFADLFRNFGVPLPLPTRALLVVGAAVQSPALWLGLSAVLVVAVLAFGRLRTSERGAAALERAVLRLPLVGHAVQLAIVARTLRMLGILLTSGVGLLDTLEVTAPATGSRLYSAALRAIADALRRGASLREAFEATALFDPLAIALIGAGEETGTADRMLQRVSHYLDVELESALATLAAAVEPALIVALGIIVGMIVFSIFLPLYSLIGSIS